MLGRVKREGFLYGDQCHEYQRGGMEVRRGQLGK